MRFCGMNVYFDTRQASVDSYLVVYGICQGLPNVVYGICQGLPSDILSIHIIIYFNGQY